MMPFAATNGHERVKFWLPSLCGRPPGTVHVMRYVATAVPGIGELLAKQFALLPRARDAEVIGNDGRNDIVAVDSRGTLPFNDLRSAEDLFAQVGEVHRPRGLPSMIETLMRPEGMERALSAYANHQRPLHSRMGYRVISRVLSEKEFLRTALRDELSKRIGKVHPRWMEADPGELEFWVLEVRPNHFVLCLRLTRANFRQRGGRVEERPGALRPSIAAAMVQLAGADDDNDGQARGPLLDPCCGSGTILSEARAAGWDPVIGTDIDVDAVRVARRNVAGAEISKADARELAAADGSVGAVVSNLPFGGQYTVPGNPREWLDTVIGEAARVVRPGGRIVMLTAAGRTAGSVIARHPRLELEQRIEVRVLGTHASMWVARVEGPQARIVVVPDPDSA